MAAKDHLVHTRGLVNTRAYSDELWKIFGPGDYGCKGPPSTQDARCSSMGLSVSCGRFKFFSPVPGGVLVHTRVVHRWGFR